MLIGLMTVSPFRNLSADLYSAQQVASQAGVPKNLLTGKDAAVGQSQGRDVGFAPRPKHVALTFDDGPDPTWTPQIQRVLDKHHVKGTFFQLGSQVAKHPEVTRQLAQDGHELGVHSFSHPNLAQTSSLRANAEVGLTQVLMQGASGQATSLLRPPFSSEPQAMDAPTYQRMHELGKRGYATVLTTADSKDWNKPDAATLARSIDAHPQQGQIVLLHDGGGDRAKTVAELDQLITHLKAKGYTVGTAAQTLGLDASAHPVGTGQRVLAGILLCGLWACVWLVAIMNWLVLIAGGFAAARAIGVLVSCVRHRRIHPRRAKYVTDEEVTVIVPAYNESAGIEASVRSLVASQQPVHVIVVDDGSSDGTADIVEGLQLPNVEVIRQKNAGKPAALNTGLAHTRTPLVVMVDGDTVFEPDTVTHLIEPFADASVGAVSGNAKVGNRHGLIGRWQHIEYVIGFNMDRRMYDLAECMPTVPGAVGAFRTQALRDGGGLHTDTLAEDTDLTMSLGRRGWKVRYEPQAVAWTEAPQTVRALWKQRYRWSYGTMQAMWKHRHGLWGRDQQGRYLRRCLSYMTMFQIVFPVMAASVDLFALYSLFSGDLGRIGLIWLTFQAIDLITAIIAFRADGESLTPLWALPLTQFGQRQLMYLVVVQSLATAVMGVRFGWHSMERYGSLNAGKPATAWRLDGGCR